MSQASDLDAAVHPQDRRNARRIAIAVIALLLLAVFGQVWWMVWGAGPNLPRDPLTAERGADGAFPQTPAAGADVTGRAAVTEAKTSATTTSSVSSSGDSRLRARSAAIMVDTQELLAQRVAHELFKELHKSPRFDSLKYYPPGTKLDENGRLPDLFITVGLKSLKESGVAPYKSIEAEVTVSMGDHPQRSSHSYIDHLTPPAITFHWNSNVEYQGSEVSLETASARYEGVGKSIAADTAKSINKFLNEAATKHGEWRRDPQEFFPAFEAAPDFPFLNAFKAERLVSGSEMATRNLTMWTFTTPRAEPDVVKRIAEGLEALGWKDATKNIDSENRHLRATRDESTQIFEVFRHADYDIEATKDEQAPLTWYCAYTHRLSQSEVVAALGKLLDRNPPEEELAAFSSWWYLDRERVAKYFAEHPPRLTPSILHLTRQAIDAKQLDEARRLLLRGDAIQRIVETRSSPSDEMKKLGEKVGLSEMPKLPDLSALEPGDLIDARKDLPKRLQTTLDQTIVLLTSADDEGQTYVTVAPVARPDAAGFAFRIRQITLRDGGSSWSDMTTGDAANDLLPTPLASEGAPTVKLKSHYSPDAKTFDLLFE